MTLSSLNKKLNAIINQEQNRMVISGRLVIGILKESIKYLDKSGSSEYNFTGVNEGGDFYDPEFH